MLSIAGGRTMDHQIVYLQRLADVLAKVGGFLAAIVAAWGIIRLLPKLLSNARLAYELSVALEGQRSAEEAAKQYRLAAESYRERIDSMMEEARDVMAKAVSASALSSAAIIYIVDLLNFIKSGKPLASAPPLPEELQQAVYDALASKWEAPKADRFFGGAHSKDEG